LKVLEAGVVKKSKNEGLEDLMVFPLAARAYTGPKMQGRYRKSAGKVQERLFFKTALSPFKAYKYWWTGKDSNLQPID